jgi:3-oxoacyl-[acyl-carrier protein] reductase
VRVNLVGTAGIAARFGAAMAEAGRGSIVLLAGGGIGGPRTNANLSAYVATKAAVVVLAETLAKELAASGVRVNAIAPGAVATSFGDEILAVGPERAGADLFDATVADRARAPSLSPFLDLLDFVLSEESSWLTGRLLSARWDPPDSLRARRHELTSSSLLQLRRVDGQLYGVLEGP